jgi:hypothetical protein
MNSLSFSDATEDTAAAIAMALATLATLAVLADDLAVFVALAAVAFFFGAFRDC